jgi:hypothetical protein
MTMTQGEVYDALNAPSHVPHDDTDLDTGDIDVMLKRANDLLYGLAREQRDLAIYDELRNDSIARITERHREATEPISRRTAELTARINGIQQIIYTADRAAGRKTFGRVLPNGTLKVTQAKELKVVYVDEAAFLAWARMSMPLVVRESYAPNKIAFAAAAKMLRRNGDQLVTEHGEPIPGVTAEVPAAAFTIVTSDGADR